jgi:hypothetical protein
MNNNIKSLFYQVIVLVLVGIVAVVVVAGVIVLIAGRVM